MNEAGVFDPDAIFHIPPFPDLKGLEAFKGLLMGFCQAITDIKWNWVEVILEGNTVVQRFTLRGKHMGSHPMIPLPTTGKEAVLEGCTLYHVKNDKIVRGAAYRAGIPIKDCTERITGYANVSNTAIKGNKYI